jgi:DNA repair photolyase
MSAVLFTDPVVGHSREESVPGPSPMNALPRVEWQERHGSALHPVPLGKQGEVMGLNLVARRGRRWGYCFASAPLTCSAEHVVYLLADTPEQLSAELGVQAGRPRAVFVGGPVDPFAPVSEIQGQTREIIEVLANHDVETWLMTRGFIRPAALRVLEAHRRRVRLTVGLTTLDRGVQRLLEPLTAPPRVRLRQIACLQALGIPVHVSLEPLVPGLTDSRESLMTVLEALSAAHVRHVTAGYLSLCPDGREGLERPLDKHDLCDEVLRQYEGGPVLRSRFAAPARHLPKARRQRGYAALMALAAGFGITVGVCRLSNPDFQLPLAAVSSQRSLLERWRYRQRAKEIGMPRQPGEMF